MTHKKLKQLALYNIQNKKTLAQKTAGDILAFLLSHPDFKTAYQNLKQAEIENAKCIAFDKEAKFDIKLLETELDVLANKYGYTLASIYPSYFCKKCNDSGFINNTTECECYKAEVNSLLLKNSGINHELNCFNEHNFDIFENKKEMITIYTKMQEWCQKDSKYKNVFISGQTGSGKTYLMECIADAIIKTYNVVIWTTAFNLNQILLKYHTSLGEEKYDILSGLLECDCLCIDDLGTEAILNNVTIEGIYRILSERIESGKRTIITSNLTLDDIRIIYGERIFSRLACKANTLMFYLGGKDLRIS